MQTYTKTAVAAAANVRTVELGAAYKLCWGCQCSKHTKNGKLTLLPGFYKFVCEDCIEAAKIKRANKLAAA